MFATIDNKSATESSDLQVLYVLEFLIFSLFCDFFSSSGNVAVSLNDKEDSSGALYVLETWIL